MNADQMLFIGFVAIMYFAVCGSVVRYIGRRAAIVVSIALILWFGFVLLLVGAGVLQRTGSRPPGMVFILGPVLVYLAGLAIALSTRRTRSPIALPLWLLIGAQSFRVIVELFIHHLWSRGIVPETLTYRGANVDIYIGASALIVAWLSTRDGWQQKVALIWNGVGLLALANVVTRAILSAPGSLNLIHTDPANRMFVTFPYMFIPAFFVPLAVTLHLLAIRAIVRSGPIPTTYGPAPEGTV